MVFIQAKSKLQESAMVNRKPDRSPGNHELFRDFAVELSQASAQAILPHFRRPMEIENKDGRDFDPVTVDLH